MKNILNIGDMYKVSGARECQFCSRNGKEASIFDQICKGKKSGRASQGSQRLRASWAMAKRR